MAYDRFIKNQNSLYDMSDLFGEEPPAPVITVNVGSQSGTLTAGTAGSAAFPVTAANLADGVYPAVIAGAPAGVTVPSGSVTIAGDSGTLTLNTSAASPSGS